MDFFSAISAHVAWKVRLEKYIAGQSTEELDPKIVGRDDGCPLGKWIQANLKTHQDVPLFRQVLEQHADFHRCAAEIISSVDRGHKAEAERKLHDDYAHLSRMIVRSITRLSKELPDM